MYPMQVLFKFLVQFSTLFGLSDDNNTHANNL